MTETYNVKSTSAWTAKVDDVWLNPPEDRDSVLTRRVLRTEIVDNPKNDQERVRIAILHQRRASKGEPWADVDHFNLATLKAGQEVRLQLNSAETQHLFKELQRLNAVAAEGIPRGERTFVVADQSEVVLVRGRARQVIRELLEGGDQEVWDAVAELQPDLFKALVVNKLHKVREASVQRFQEELARDQWTENDWQTFFEENTWIFGYGLSYRFLSTVEAQPHYGGVALTGKGAQRGDYLTLTEAERRFTVLVEIKTPSAILVGEKPYRNQAHLIGGHVAGGVAQLQANCRTWELSGSQEEENRERFEKLDGYTIHPKGILVVGHLGQLDTPAKRNSFELFRRNLHNPEVITFDELLERSRHLLLNERKRLDQVDDGEPTSDLPF